MLMVVGSWVPCFATSSSLKATYVTDYTSSDGLQLVEQTDLGEKTGYVDRAGETSSYGQRMPALSGAR